MRQDERSNSFTPAQHRLDVTTRRYPAFPRQAAALVRLIKHLHRAMHDRANAVLKPWGLNQPEYTLLMMMYGTEGNAVTPGELAEAAGEKSANITRLTNQLCDKGLIQRGASADDRRRVILSLTPAGEELLGACLPDVCALLERQAAGLSPQAMDQLQEQLLRYLDHLDTL